MIAFYNGLQLKYYLEAAQGKAANINSIAADFQRALDRFVGPPLASFIIPLL